MPTGVKTAVRRTYRPKPKVVEPVEVPLQTDTPPVEATPDPEAIVKAMEHVGEAIEARVTYHNGHGMALEEHFNVHLEDRLASYLNALVTGGECNSRNARVRALIIADFAWHGDSLWQALVADGMKAYYDKYSGG